ncbi:Rpr2-domain-containing protein [Amylocystis lapponica]|nr:Rpr2-domain-containing protein [Amylocystis lapponica]
MAKKNKGDQEPSASLSSVSNRDIIQRINFLYQASTYLSSIAVRPATIQPRDPEPTKPCICGTPGCTTVVHTSDTLRKEKHRKRRTARHPASAADLSRSYVKAMHLIGKKTTVKMDPALKRTLCKGCFSVLIPGSTATVRVHPSPSHGHSMAYTCTACHTVRRIPAPPVLDPDATPQDASAMDVDTVDGGAVPLADGVGPRRSRKKRRKPPVARIPPLFDRKGVHVVYCGNEKIE